VNVNFFAVVTDCSNQSELVTSNESWFEGYSLITVSVLLGLNFSPTISFSASKFRCD